MKFLIVIRSVLINRHTIVAAALLLFGIVNFISLGQKKNWPTVKGVVLESWAKPKADDNSKAEIGFIYSYELNGKKYTSSNVGASRFADSKTYLTEANDLTSAHPKDSAVTVYVNPSDSAESYLEIQPSTIDYALPILGLSGIVIFAVWRYSNKQTAE